MRPVIGFHIFGMPWQKLAQSTESKDTYTAVRLSLHKDTLLAAPRMRPVIRFYSFDSCTRRS